MSEVPKLQRFNEKQVTRNDKFVFILHLKNEFFNLTEGYTPRPVTYTHFFNAKRCSLVFSSVPDLAFIFPLMLVHLSVQ